MHQTMQPVNDQDWLAERFEASRSHLRGVAYRMLGSLPEADDAVQEAWIRLSRTDTSDVENLRAWLTTVVARVCLNMLRSRNTRREASLETHVPDPLVSSGDGIDPEQEALLGDSVGLAMQIVLDSLSPPERVAFVLHDVFAVPFDEIAPIVGRSPTATRQLASRARRRLQGERTVPDPDLQRQREVVEAFLAAAREGDFDALVATLDPDVVVRADLGGGVFREVRGAHAVATNARAVLQSGLVVHLALINGAVGVVSMRDGRPFSVGGFTVSDGKIAAMDYLLDPERLAELDLTVLDG